MSVGGEIVADATEKVEKRDIKKGRDMVTLTGEQLHNARLPVRKKGC